MPCNITSALVTTPVGWGLKQIILMFQYLAKWLRPNQSIRAGASAEAPNATRAFVRPDNLPDWQALFATEPDLWKRSLAAAGRGVPVLVASNVGGHGPVSVMESMLATALTLRGAKVHMLLCDGALPACMRAQLDANVKPDAIIDRKIGETLCPGCFGRGNRVYEQLGLPVHKLSELVTEEERSMAIEMGSSIELDGLKSWTWNGLRIGEHAIAGALRYFARGQLELGNPEESGVVRAYLEASLLTAFATQRLVDREGIRHATFHHGIYVPQGIVGEVCRQKNVHVSNWVVSYRQNTVIFSHDNTYHQTLMDEPIAQWEDLEWSDAAEENVLSYLRSRWDGGRDWIYFHEKPDEDVDKFVAESGLDPNKPIIGMLTNVFWDAQLHFRQNAFSDILEWTLKTIEWFRGRPDLQLLVRIHPAEIRGTVKSRQKLADEIAAAIPDLPPNVVVVPPDNAISTYAAMLRCDSVIIYGTKMGVELTSIGIPVIVAGEAWIRNKGITIDAQSQNQYFEVLDKLPLRKRLDEETVRRARKYAYHFFFRRMVPLPFVEPMDRNPNFRIVLGSLGDILPGKYPGLDVICDGILDADEPFVYRAEELGLHDAASPEAVPT